MEAPVRTVRKGSTVAVPQGLQGGGVTSSQIPAFIRTSVEMVQPVETEPVSVHSTLLDLIVEKVINRRLEISSEHVCTLYEICILFELHLCVVHYSTASEIQFLFCTVHVFDLRLNRMYYIIIYM